MSVELRELLRHRYGEGYQKMSAALKVPKNTVASILKWNTFGTTKPLPRTGCLAKLSNQRRRALVREMTKYPMVPLTELQSSCVEMGEHSRRTTISAALHQSGLYGRVTRVKPLLSKRHMTARIEFAKRHLTIRNKILWSDETKMEFRTKSSLSHLEKHGGGSIMLWGYFSAERTGRLVRSEGKMNGAKYREILDENLL